MAITFSSYVRQGKKTFKFIKMSGGAYGCNILYEYGVFNGDRLRGMRFAHDKYTEIEDDPDEKDGIGGMSTIRKHSVFVGEFLNGKPHGFCYELKGGKAYNATNFGFYKNGLPDGNLQGEGQVDEEFSFSDWQKMPVDEVKEDGFSVLRQMDYFSDGDLRFSITEGQFINGKLNGFGSYYYDSNVNGYHAYNQLSGVFKDGKLIFGLQKGYENTGGKGKATLFDYADERDAFSCGKEVVYGGKKYIGEETEGVPNGIGCLFEDDEKMLKGTFKDGKLHGIGATYKFIEGEWVAYDFMNNITDRSYFYRSWGIYVNGEFKPTMTWEEFFDNCEKLKKV